MDPKGRLQQQIDDLKRQLDELTRRLLAQGRDPVGSHFRQVRLAKTASDGSSYPTSGDTFPIVFQNGTFTEASGDQTPTYVNRKSGNAVEYGHHLGGYLKSGTYVWVVRDNKRNWILAPASASLVRFELTATLTAGSSANAKVLEWNGAAYAVIGETVTVRDYFSPGVFSGVSTDQGWAVYMPDRGGYEIVFMETLAGKTKVKSTDALDYLDQQFADVNVSPQYDSAEDIKVEFDVEGSAGSEKLRAFVDADAIAGYSESVQQALTHDSDGTLRWIDIEACP